MKIVYTIVCFVLISCCTVLCAGAKPAAAELFTEANKLYQEQRYAQALSLYLDVYKQGYDNFSLNYNLGNCYFKLDQPGKARFYYEQALIYKPFNRELFYNLSVLYDKLLENPHEGEQEIMNIRLIYGIPLSIILLSFVVLFVLSFSFLILYVVKIEKVFLILFIPFVCFTLLFTLLFFLQFSDYNTYRGIITDEYANIYIAPYTDTVITTLREGVKTNIVYEIDEYVKVSFEDGTLGWVKKSKIITNLPDN